MKNLKICLPQFDKDSIKREMNLNKTRTLYRYNYNLIPSHPVIDEVPTKEYPKLKWLYLLAKIGIRLLRNSLAVSENTAWSVDRILVPFIFRLKMIGRLFTMLFIKSPTKFFIYSGKYVQRYTKPGKALKLEDYNKLFLKIGIPKLNRDFDTDENFARMRVAGWNPTVIEGIKKIPNNFPITDSIFSSIPEFNGDKLSKAIQESRLFITNYQALSDLKNGDQPRQQKYVYAPIALFALTQGKRFLRPIAIQCDQNPKEHSLFTPLSDPWGWKMAKAVVNSADGNHHELIAHLAKTHLFLEPIIISTYRQFSNRHPIYKLLIPHFYGTIFINYFARKDLIAPGGGVEHLLSGTIQSSKQVSLKATKSNAFNDSMFPVDLENRKVKDKELLPYYPFRDDGLVIWELIRNWVKEYIKIYYPSNKELLNDTELKLWCGELSNYAGGRVNNFGEDGKGKINSISYLIKALTHIIFTATASHSAINNPQRDVMIYAPQVPIGLYDKAPKKKQKYSEEDWLAMLPPLDLASLQLNLGYTLGGLLYKKLGRYPMFWFSDSKVNKALNKFNENLKQAEKLIKTRNEGKFPYKGFLPSRIAQSINI